MTLNSFFQMIKLEVKARTPFPVVEFFFMLFILLCLSSSGVLSDYYGTVPGVDINRVRFSSFVHMNWLLAISRTILILAIILTILISISIAGEYEKGTMTTLLSLPVSRVQYLGAKCFVYGILSISASLSALLIVWLLTPFPLSALEMLEVTMICIRSVVFFLSLSIFVAIISRKASITLLTLLAIDLGILFVFSSLDEPFRYFFDPSTILIATDLVDALLWGIALPLITGMVLFGLAFYQFSKIDILGGEE
ncbi:MAG: ABC transporter permease [Candidatus Hodarchaeota archaeon]